MKANESKLGDLLKKANTRFVIPVYQRNYNWTKTQCDQLIEDILIAGKSTSVTAHFLGSIVYVHEGVYSSTDITELSIIDGQQRLTTTMLVYIRLYRLARKLAKQKEAEKIHDQVLFNKYDGPDGTLKLKQTEENEQALIKLIEGSENEVTTYSRVIENYKVFERNITEENFDLVLNGVEKLMYVDIALDHEKDDPQKIFESLNSTGLALSEADLIRNYILMGEKSNRQKIIYSKYWEPIERLAKDERLNDSRVSDLIRDYLTIVNRKIPNKNKVYESFKRKYVLKDIEIEEILSNIKIYASYYNKLLNPHKEKSSTISKELGYINKLKINVSYPFIMEVYHDYSKDLISEEIFVQALRLIQNFAWRRSLIGLPSNALNKIFMKLYSEIDINNYIASLEKSLLKKKGSQRFPRNPEIKNILLEKDVYNMKAGSKTYLLDRLENHNNKEYVLVEGNSKITVEHIFPQKPVTAWENDLGKKDYLAFKESYLHTMANLTLSGNNGSLGNKTFLEKRNMNKNNEEQGYKYSRLWLNRFLSEIDSWTLDSFKARFELMTTRFFEVWPMPTTTLTEIEESEEGELNIFEAEDPTNKKLDYMVFRGEKENLKTATELYLNVISKLFEINPAYLISPNIVNKLKLTKNKSELRDPKYIGGTYYVESSSSTKTKFENLMFVLKYLDLEEELYIKYRS